MEKLNNPLEYAKKQDPCLNYTDLAIERCGAQKDAFGVEFYEKSLPLGKLEKVKILSDEAARKLGKPMGTYSTLTFGKLTLLSEEELYDAIDLVARELCKLTEDLKIYPDRILVVCLGNERLTPDTVGPKSAELIKPTYHLREDDEESFGLLECSEISVIRPGVTASTGLEAVEIVKGVSRRVIPSLVIAIDSIMTRSPERLGSTVQISDTGICPGSGLMSKRKAINEDSVGCPVISLGIPTVISSHAFTSDTEEMLVSPREIDEITNIGAKIISGGINQAFGIF